MSDYEDDMTDDDFEFEVPPPKITEWGLCIKGLTKELRALERAVLAACVEEHRAFAEKNWKRLSQAESVYEDAVAKYVAALDAKGGQ